MAGALRGIPAVMVAEEWAGSFRRRTLKRGRNFFREILYLILLVALRQLSWKVLLK
jgi:hypothetical protein